MAWKLIATGMSPSWLVRCSATRSKLAAPSITIGIPVRARNSATALAEPVAERCDRHHESHSVKWTPSPSRLGVEHPRLGLDIRQMDGIAALLDRDGGRDECERRHERERALPGRATCGRKRRRDRGGGARARRYEPT